MLCEGHDPSEYYARRAEEYEEVYQKRERQADLRRLSDLVCAQLQGLSVLELACGTGYWTERVAPFAQSIVAIDSSPEVLSVARRKSYPKERVRFMVGDAFRPDSIVGEFDAAFAGFWWSHIPVNRLDPFLSHLGRRLGPQARVLFLDNRYVEGSSTPISETDDEGNSYQLRRLKDGSTYRVLKNFPDRPDLLATARQHGVEVTIHWFDFFWCLSYRTHP